MKTVSREQRHRRVRSRITGTAERPRLVVFRGTKTLSAQLINDTTGTVLASATTAKLKDVTPTVDGATKIGHAIAAAATQLKITTAVFDRAGYAYHGQVKAVADGARDGGLKI